MKMATWFSKHGCRSTEIANLSLRLEQLLPKSMSWKHSDFVLACYHRFVAIINLNLAVRKYQIDRRPLKPVCFQFDGESPGCTTSIANKLAAVGVPINAGALWERKT